MIFLSEAAVSDLAGIDNATAAIWGAEQADRYTSFLNRVLAELEDNPELGNVVDQQEQYRSYLAKFTRRRSAQGHRILYRKIPDGLLIVRILHTAMRWPERL